MLLHSLGVSHKLSQTEISIQSWCRPHRDRGIEYNYIILILLYGMFVISDTL